jgi:hypothetical protein
MCGFSQLSKSDCSAWTGDQSKFDCSGIEDDSEVLHHYQRVTSCICHPGAEVLESYKAGMTTKYDRKDDPSTVLHDVRCYETLTLYVGYYQET